MRKCKSLALKATLLFLDQQKCLRNSESHKMFCLSTFKSSHTPTNTLDFCESMGKIIDDRRENASRWPLTQLVCKPPIFLICIALPSILLFTKGNTHQDTRQEKRQQSTSKSPSLLLVYSISTTIYFIRYLMWFTTPA